MSQNSQIHKTSDIVQELEPLAWKFWKKKRYIIVLMVFLGFCNMYTLRVNLSFAIVAMTENRTIYGENGTIIGYEQLFPWSSTEQGFILSSFFYGIIVSQIPGGYIGSYFGATLIYGIGVLVAAILTIFSPFAATYGGPSILITFRVIEGFFEGIAYTCVHVIWSKWAPPLERSRMAAVGFAGAYCGATIALPICGLLAVAFGWESLFYFFGGIACIWYLVWILLVRETPDKDRFIAADELRYIQSTVKTNNNNKKISKYPWKSILTSKPIWAVAISSFCENWGFFTLLTQLPTFLKDAMGYNLNDVGFLSALPYLTMSILLFIAGYLADFVQVKGWLNTSQVRRYFNCSAFLGQSIFLLLAAILFDPIGSIICITLAVGIGAFAICGYMINNLDLAPQYAGMLSGITGLLALLPGCICPSLTGYIVQTGSIDEWRLVFYISSGIYLFGAFAYWFWSSGELQPWATPQQNASDNGIYIEANQIAPSKFIYINEIEIENET